MSFVADLKCDQEEAVQLPPDRDSDSEEDATGSESE